MLPDEIVITSRKWPIICNTSQKGQGDIWQKKMIFFNFWLHFCLHFPKIGSNLDRVDSLIFLGVRMYKNMFYFWSNNDDILLKIQFNSFKTSF